MASPAFPTVRHSPTPTVIYGGDALVVADDQLTNRLPQNNQLEIAPSPRPFGQPRGGNIYDLLNAPFLDSLEGVEERRLCWGSPASPFYWVRGSE